MSEMISYELSSGYVDEYRKKVAQLLKMAGCKVKGYIVTPQTEEQAKLLDFFADIDDLLLPYYE